jgi:hypothetical protein
VYDLFSWDVLAVWEHVASGRRIEGVDVYALGIVDGLSWTELRACVVCLNIKRGQCSEQLSCEFRGDCADPVHRYLGSSPFDAPGTYT